MKQQKDFSHKIFIFLYLTTLLFSFLITYNNIFNSKVDLNGDNAGYYILGTSIASGEGYTNIHTKNANSHNHFSPGYPSLIAMTSVLFSSDIIVIKKLNGFLFLLSVALIFLIVYHLTFNPHIAFITSFFSLLNYHLLSYSTIMMSEIPFLFFSLTCILLFLKTDVSKPLFKNIPFIALIVTLIISFYIRPTGIALISGIAFILFMNKNWKYLGSMIAFFLLFTLPWQIRTHSLGGSSYLKQIVRKNPYKPELGTLEISDWISRFFQNLERYITREIPSASFNFVEVSNYSEEISQSEWITGGLTLATIILGAIQLKEKSLLILFYLISTFGILLLWPPVWSGPRFIVPIIPLLLFFMVYGITHVLSLVKTYFLHSHNKHAFYFIMAISCFIYGFNLYQKPLTPLKKSIETEYPANFKNYFELAQWVKTNTPDTSTTCCRKGQLFFLHSKKHVSNFKNTLDTEEQIEYLKKNGTDYVVLEQLGYSSTNTYLYPAIKRYPNKFKVIKHIKSPDTYLLKFSPDLGYTGEWVNNQRSGYGTFVWENGNAFAGIWKDNVRNGKGILYFPDGRQLEGFWVNDKLNGEVTIKSKEGNIIETSIYVNNKKKK